MKGFAMLKIGQTGWVEKEKPVCGDFDAIVKPTVVSPCSSDIHTVWAGAIGERHNMILGHEAVGEVVEVGKLVKDFKVGDKVIVPAITPNWNSLEAQRGYAMHSGGALAGWKFSNFKDGVFGEYCHVNDADGNLAHLPDDVDPIDAVMLCDMVTTGFHGVEMANVQFGDTVCIIGIGPVGLMAVRGSYLRGASRLFAVGSRPNCIEVAKEFGASDIINYKNGDIVEQIMEKTNGKGVDRVIIAGGNVDTFEQAVNILKPGGTIGNVNYLGSGDFVKVPRLGWGNGMAHKTIIGGLTPGGRLRMEKLVSMIQTKRINPRKLVTHIFNGKEHIEEALLLMKDKPKDLIKPVVIL